MAGGALETIADRHGAYTSGKGATSGGNHGCATIMDEFRQAISSMALHAAIGHFTLGIPITERHGVARKVTGIIACELAYITTEVFDGVVKQLNNIFVTMGKGTWILDGYLVVISSLEQASGPVRVILAIGAHEVGICGCIVLNFSASGILGIGLNLGKQSFLQALHFIVHAFFFIAIAIVIPGRCLRFPNVLEATFGQNSITVADSTLLNLYLKS